MSAENLKVLLIEDDPIVAGVVEGTLRNMAGEGCEVVHSDTLEGGLVNIAKGGFSALLLDLHLPDSEGLETVQRVVQADSHLPIVVMSSLDDESVAEEAVHLGVQDYLIKGQDRGRQIVRALRYAIMRKETELATLESEQRFRDYAETAADWFWEMDADLRFTTFSEAAFEALGLEHDQLIGLKREDFVSANGDQDAMALHMEHLRQHQSFRNFLNPVDVGDTERFLRMSGKPRYDENDVFLGYRGVASDVTEQIEAERFGEQMFSVMIDAVEAFPEGVALFDEEDNLLVTNSAAMGVIPGAGDLFVPGHNFRDILQGVAARGILLSAAEDPQAWVEQALSRLGDGVGVLCEDLTDGGVLWLHQFPTERGGKLRQLRATMRFPVGA